jgi:hypothetical protein
MRKRGWGERTASDRKIADVECFGSRNGDNNSIQKQFFNQINPLSPPGTRHNEKK